MKYRNERWGFELMLPEGWHEPGILRRIFFFFRYAHQATHPEFYGPHGASLKIAIGPIYPIPSVEEQQENLQRIAIKYGHEVMQIGRISVGGKDHATMVCRIPFVGVVKNYSLIFDGIEYLVTARGNFDDCDLIVRSFSRYR